MMSSLTIKGPDNADLFRRAISAVKAARPLASNKRLYCILFEAKNGGLRTVATNGHIMFIHDSPLAWPPDMGAEGKSPLPFAPILAARQLMAAENLNNNFVEIIGKTDSIEFLGDKWIIDVPRSPRFVNYEAIEEMAFANDKSELCIGARDAAEQLKVSKSNNYFIAHGIKIPASSVRAVLANVSVKATLKVQYRDPREPVGIGVEGQNEPPMFRAVVMPVEECK